VLQNNNFNFNINMNLTPFSIGNILSSKLPINNEYYSLLGQGALGTSSPNNNFVITPSGCIMTNTYILLNDTINLKAVYRYRNSKNRDSNINVIDYLNSNLLFLPFLIDK